LSRALKKRYQIALLKDETNATQSERGAGIATLAPWIDALDEQGSRAGPIKDAHFVS